MNRVQTSNIVRLHQASSVQDQIVDANQLDSAENIVDSPQSGSPDGEDGSLDLCSYKCT
jgi:hypothetical protein